MTSNQDSASVPLVNDGGQSKGAIVRPNFSSLPLQMAVYFNFHYAPFFFILNICLFVYKAVRYYYPGRFLGWELTTIFLYIFIEEVRLMMLSKGNKTSTLRPLLISLLLAVPIIILHAYYLAAQTYVLRVDIVINAIAFVFLGIELLFSILVILNVFTSSTRF
jgi:transmembrane protein 216